MKRLIWKDLLNLKLATLLLLPCYSLWAVNSGYFSLSSPSEVTVALSSIGIIGFLFIGRSAFYYDETSAFDKYLSAMPVPKFTIVASRYMICFLTSLLGIISTLVLAKLQGGQLHIPIQSVVIAVFFTLLFIAILLPALFRYGYIKTKYILMFITVLAITLAPVLSKIGWLTRFLAVTNMPPWVLLSILLVVTYGAMTFSLQLSTRIYQNKEF